MQEFKKYLQHRIKKSFHTEIVKVLQDSMSQTEYNELYRYLLCNCKTIKTTQNPNATTNKLNLNLLDTLAKEYPIITQKNKELTELITKQLKTKDFNKLHLDIQQLFPPKEYGNLIKDTHNAIKAYVKAQSQKK